MLNTAPKFKPLTCVHHTAEIQTENEVTVCMDIQVNEQPCSMWGAEYEVSQPYVLIDGKPTLAVGLTLAEQRRLEDEAHDLANGVHETQTNPGYCPE